MKESIIKYKKRNKKFLNDKKLLKIYNELGELRYSKKNYTLQKLDKPIRDGWEKFYILRKDISPEKIKTLQKILDAINVKIYCKNKDFKYKPYKSKVKKDIPHELKDIAITEFHNFYTTAAEKAYFSLTPVYDQKKHKWYNVWRFHGKYFLEVKIRPSYITHIKILDAEIERKIAELEKMVGWGTPEMGRIENLKGWTRHKDILDEKMRDTEKFIKGAIDEAT
jgi:hypothetical protein